MATNLVVLAVVLVVRNAYRHDGHAIARVAPVTDARATIAIALAVA
jgi:hypothetical protein